MATLDFRKVATKTAIIVTTYNAHIQQLTQNIRDYIEYASLVVICDNSTELDIHLKIQALSALSERIYVHSMGGNKGIAAAQNAGVQIAIAKGYQYFIEVDQDSTLPYQYTLNISRSYCQLVNQGFSVGGIGPIAVRSNDGYIYHGRAQHTGIVQVDKTLSSGFFYPLEAFKTVGEKDEGLFIDYVDWDWCWRASAKNLQIFVDTDLVLPHLLGSGHRKFLYWHVGIPAPFRHYYQYRNSLAMLRRAHVPNLWKFRRILINIFKIPFYLIFTDRRAMRSRYILAGIVDFFAGRTGPIQ